MTGSTNIETIDLYPAPVLVEHAHMTGIVRNIGHMVRNGNSLFLLTVEAKYGSQFKFLKGSFYNVVIDMTVKLFIDDPLPFIPLIEKGDLLQLDFSGEIQSGINIIPKSFSSAGHKKGNWEDI